MAITLLGMVLLGACNASSSQESSPSTTTSSVLPTNPSTPSASGVALAAARQGEAVDPASFAQALREGLNLISTMKVSTQGRVAQMQASSTAVIDQSNPQAVGVRNEVVIAGLGTFTVISIGDQLYIRTPQSAGKYYSTTTATAADMFNNPALASLLNPQRLNHQLSTAIRHVSYEAEQPLEGIAAKRYQAQLDSAGVATIVAASGTVTQPQAQFWLDSQHRLVKSILTFTTAGQQISTTSTLGQFNQPVTVTRPPADQTMPLPQPAGSSGVGLDSQAG